MTDDFDPTQTDDPDEIRKVHEELRASCPVAHTSAHGGFWALTRYADVIAAAQDSRTFISSVRAVVPSDPRGLRRPPLNFDAPRHTPYRRALDRTLHRRRLDRLEPAIRAHARREAARMVGKGGGDLAAEFATRLPAWATTEWLNLEPETAPVLAETAAAWVDAWRKLDKGTVNAMSERMYAIARDLVAERTREPLPVGEDPASSLLAERSQGRPLEPEQVLGALRQSLVVGMVAPPILLGATFHHLSDDPALQDHLRRCPEDVPDAVEEFIRLYTPYRGFARTVTEEVRLHGRTIRPGEPITLVYASANRDASVFPEPDRFRLRRPNIHRHLGFGRGRHQCAGMPLARMVIRLGLEEMLAATTSIRTRRVPGGARMPEMGPVSVPAELVAAPPAG
ncbi:cytochrome P450 [Saccharothrix syringae]|uniref:Cytochrome P450 n=1 Tax=Saccharothrix syringae TaxID=103733 RepID=A0A5Q0H3U1_SACSY|nr:cytochrome P450 [Saccharothrix syringae]QFZ20789.1 cytochrome P450 [Saccharothrix syringae]